MKALHAVLVFCGVALGALLASLAPAVAQPERAATPPRFQISAFAGQAMNGDMVHGCYTIDTGCRSAAAHSRGCQSRA